MTSIKTEFNAVADSGKRQEFSTGSVRDTNEGKGRYDLLSPLALRRLAVHTENGAKKYGDRNWEKGQPLMRYLDSALRHIFKHIEGKRDEDHLAAAMWNIQGIIHTEEMIAKGMLPSSLDDRPGKPTVAASVPEVEPRFYIQEYDRDCYGSFRTTFDVLDRNHPGRYYECAKQWGMNGSRGQSWGWFEDRGIAEAVLAELNGSGA